MNDLENQYFEWLLTQIEADVVTEGIAYLGGLLHDCEFHRRVGNDINRAMDGANLRKEFFSHHSLRKFKPTDVNDLMAMECTWLEMLIALARALDYLYDGGVYSRYEELIFNMKLNALAISNPRRSAVKARLDRRTVEITTRDIDESRISKNGVGGIFPLRRNQSVDQREVEIWDQHAAYFRERLG